MTIHASIKTLIGHTPLVSLSRFSAVQGVPNADIIGKVEFFNPGGSVKERIALSMVEDAEASGTLRAGGTIIEPTSGNTGIGIAIVGAALGYRVIVTMPDTMSAERRSLMQVYGAKVVLTPGTQGMKGAIAQAEQLAASIEGAIVLGQFTNSANPAAHYAHTGPEIWHDTEGNIDILVAGIGTGGTITGAGSYLKQMNANIKVIAVEPEETKILRGGTHAPHKIQGIGAGFLPGVLNTQVYDEVIGVSSDDAMTTARALPASEGLFVGISSGAALHAAVQVARRPENAGKRIVVVLPDSGDRYLSTPLAQFPELETSDL